MEIAEVDEEVAEEAHVVDLLHEEEDEVAAVEADLVAVVDVAVGAVDSEVVVTMRDPQLK